MSLQTTHIGIGQETAALLRRKAAARNLSLEAYLRALAEADAPQPPQAELTPAERAQAWAQWVERHAVSVSPFVDDSRESIYTREDEAL
jgi:predicted RecB family nuclease